MWQMVFKMFTNAAWAQAADAAPTQPSPIMQMVPMIFAMVVLFGVMSYSNKKKQKQHQQMLEALKVGQEVLTTSGILGTIAAFKNDYVALEIADGVEMKILKSQGIF